MISRIFPSKFQQIHMIFVSVHSVHSIFKICQTVADVFLTNQFLQFFILIFGEFLKFGPTVGCSNSRCCTNINPNWWPCRPAYFLYWLASWKIGFSILEQAFCSFHFSLIEKKFCNQTEVGKSESKSRKKCFLFA